MTNNLVSRTSMMKRRRLGTYEAGRALAALDLSLASRPSRLAPQLNHRKILPRNRHRHDCPQLNRPGIPEGSNS